MKNAIQKTVQVMLLVCISYVGFAQKNGTNTQKGRPNYKSTHTINKTTGGVFECRCCRKPMDVGTAHDTMLCCENMLTNQMGNSKSDTLKAKGWDGTVKDDSEPPPPKPQPKPTTPLLAVPTVRGKSVNTTNGNIDKTRVQSKSDKTITKKFESQPILAYGVPVVGALVKCGKDSGKSFSMMTVGTTNEKGEVTMKIKEAGDYKIEIIGSSANLKAKGLNDPVKGVKVALGHNPSKTIITNSNGEAEFKDLEIGEYKIIITYLSEVKDDIQIKQKQQDK